MIAQSCIKVAVFSPIRGIFDYLPNDASVALKRGQRVLVPFRNSMRVGLVIEVADNLHESRFSLKNINLILDEQPLVSKKMIRLAEWASGYYHYPLGPAISHLFPPYLRKNKQINSAPILEWRISIAGKNAISGGQRLGKSQIKIFEKLRELGSATTTRLKTELSNIHVNPVIKKLEDKGWIEKQPQKIRKVTPCVNEMNLVKLNKEQLDAVSFIRQKNKDKKPIVLNGVTGSGKTEVYIELIRTCLDASKQVILLAPEITLAEHLFKRLDSVFPGSVGIAHSSYSEKKRLATWQACKQGELNILVGTRSAVWTSMRNLGLIIVDEEHDPSYRQQDGFMYSGRDTAIVRAKFENAQILLGSATPSLETIRNVELKKFSQVFLTKGAVAPKPPLWEIVNLKTVEARDGLTHRLLDNISETLKKKEQALLFLNRRGYSPVVICNSCGYKPTCKNCDWTMVYHKSLDLILCHHCGYTLSMNQLNCCTKKKMRPIGLGTERIQEAIKNYFPEAIVERVDSDIGLSTTEIHGLFKKVSERKIDILIGTQMVAKGLDFSGITLIGILNSDGALYSGEFKAEERFAQLLIQVSGRAARSIKRGRVILQSEHPDHPIIKKIIDHGYQGYVSATLKERKNHNVPPFSLFALIKASSKQEARVKVFLKLIHRLLSANTLPTDLIISQAVPMTIYKKAGLYRSVIIIKSQSRIEIQNLIAKKISEIELLSKQNKVKWSVELDPEGML